MILHVSNFQVLREMNNLIHHWATGLWVLRAPSRLRDKSEESYKLFLFGSVKMNTHLAGAAMDLLCVTATFISREDFFQSFFEILKKQVGSRTSL